MTFLLGLAGLAIRIFLWVRKSTARMLGRAESEREALKEPLNRVEKAREARRKLRRTLGYLGRVRDKYNRDR